MRISLNNTKRHSERESLINEPMGGAGDPYYYPTHEYSVATGIDRGNGYWGYTSITYFLSRDYNPQDWKNKLIEELKKLGYDQFVQEYLEGKVNHG